LNEYPQLLEIYNSTPLKICFNPNTQVNDNIKSFFSEINEQLESKKENMERIKEALTNEITDRLNKDEKAPRGPHEAFEIFKESLTAAINKFENKTTAPRV
jgi:predicted RNase H-like HicB family nuclease